MKSLLGLFWVMAVLGVLGIVITYSEPEPHAQDNKTETTPSNKGSSSDLGMSKEENSQRSRWTEYKEKIEENEKVITAVSTVFIAAFTVILAFATAFLYIATRNLVEGADDTSQRQLRAYIGLHSADSTVYRFAEGGYAFIAHAELRNYGQTPAYDLTVKSNAKIDTIDKVPFDDFPELERGVPGIAFRDVPFGVDIGWPISDEDRIALFTRKKVFFFWGRTEYRDAFGKYHYFAFRLASGEIKVGTDSIYTMKPHGRGYEAN